MTSSYPPIPERPVVLHGYQGWYATYSNKDGMVSVRPSNQPQIDWFRDECGDSDGDDDDDGDDNGEDDEGGADADEDNAENEDPEEDVVAVEGGSVHR
jgi:hypothetical protein